MRQEVFIDELPPLLNVWHKLHYRGRAKEKDKWQVLILAQNLKKHESSVIITFTRVSTQPADLDGVGASFKPVGDALVRNNIISDDSPDVMVELRLKWRKAPSLKEQGVELIIEDA